MDIELFQRAIAEIEHDVPVVDLQETTAQLFEQIFGTTTEIARMGDIRHQVLALTRAMTRKQRRGKLGDAIAALLMLAHEQEIDIVNCVQESLQRILDNRETYLMM